MNQATHETVEATQVALAAAIRELPSLASQGRLQASLKPLLLLAPPVGTNVQVSLRHTKNDRQVKRTAPVGNWQPETGSVSISYESDPTSNVTTADLSAKDKPIQRFPRFPTPEEDLIQALAIAERDQPTFVALKWFRDTFLPYRGLEWAAEQERRHEAIKNTINRNWILTAKIANPRSPQFPTTTIRINRHLPEVREILDRGGADSAFSPVVISGKPLSDTVLQDRR